MGKKVKSIGGQQQSLPYQYLKTQKTKKTQTRWPQMEKPVEPENLSFSLRVSCPTGSLFKGLIPMPYEVFRLSNSSPPLFNTAQ